MGNCKYIFKKDKLFLENSVHSLYFSALKSSNVLNQINFLNDLKHN